MSKNTTKQLVSAMKSAQGHFSKMSSKEKSTLEKTWDVEHAYYSSALEGSDLDKKEFEKLAEKVE